MKYVITTPSHKEGISEMVEIPVMLACPSYLLAAAGDVAMLQLHVVLKALRQKKWARYSSGMCEPGGV